MELKPGTFLKEKWYKITRQIGEGGFGITYLADELFFSINRYDKKRNVSHPVPVKVVIKELFYSDFCTRDSSTNEVIPASEFKDQWNDLKRRMEDEGRSLSEFDHRHMVGVRDAFLENGTIYTVMDYIDGGDLETVLLQKKLLEPAVAVKYITHILSALSAIHDKNMYHFDVKPSNIMISTADEAVLIDFGAALAYDSDGEVETMKSRLSKIKRVQGGYVPYCPLEIEAGYFDFTKFDEALDCPKTIDLYSVGATFYRCLTGNIPSSATRLVTERENLQIPENLRGQIDVRYLEVIKHAMQNVVKRRFQTADEFITALEEIQSEEPNSFYGLFNIGEIAFNRKEYGKALGYYHKARGKTRFVDDTSRLCEERIIECEYLIKKKEEEENVLPEDIYIEGEAAFAGKDYQAAVRLYEKALDLSGYNPTHSTLYLEKGSSIKDRCLKRIDECEKEIEKKEYETKVIPRHTTVLPGLSGKRKRRVPLFIIVLLATILVAFLWLGVSSR